MAAVPAILLNENAALFCLEEGLPVRRRSVAPELKAVQQNPYYGPASSRLHRHEMKFTTVSRYAEWLMQKKFLFSIFDFLGQV